MKTSKDIPKRTFILFFFSLHCIVLFPLRTSASWRSAKCTWRLFKVWRNWPNSKLLCYSERGEPRLSFGYKFVGLPWKLSKDIPNRTFIFIFFLHTVLYCFHWEHRQVEGVLSAHGGSLRYEGIGQIQNWYVILKGENLGFYLDINLSASLEKLLKLYPNVHSYLFFSSYSIVLFPLRTPASWRSAKCTRRVLKVWSHWPNSKLICYPERGTRRLSFGYMICRPPLKTFKDIPNRTFILYYFYSTLYCTVSTENIGKLKEC